MELRARQFEAEPVQLDVQLQIPLEVPAVPPAAQEPAAPSEPDVVPPSPPPEPVEPSAFTAAVTRMVELESQLDFAIAKHLQLARQSEILKVQVFTLRDLPVGRESFQEDLEALIASHDKIKKEVQEQRRQKEETLNTEVEEANMLGDAALRGCLASEDTTDEGFIVK